MRIGDDLFDDGVAFLRISVGDSVFQRVAGQTLYFCEKMALLLVEKTLPIGDEILKITDLRPIYGWIIDLGQDTVPHGEPYPAGGRIGSAHSILAAMGPARLDAGPAEGLWLPGKIRHVH